MEKALDSLFIKGEYWHGNEPGHQIPFMYNFTDAPWKTQKVVQNILNEEYSDGPGGLSGNDDAGQISSWYIFSSIGFYPVDPVSNDYQICTPIFDSVSIHLENGKIFKIITHRKTSRSLYIKSIKLNGQPYQERSINYQNIIKGGVLEFSLVDDHK